MDVEPKRSARPKAVEIAQIVARFVSHVGDAKLIQFAGPKAVQEKGIIALIA